MHQLLQQIFSGLAAGAIYASLALALVMIYRATDLVNFAQGEMAMFSTYIAWTLVNAGLPFWAAFVLTLVVSFLGGMTIERVLIRPVENAPVLAAVVVTIGLLLIFNALAGWIFTYTLQEFPSPFPDRTMFGALMTTRDLGVIGVTLVMLLLLFAFFRFTATGLAMRAAAQNPESARLCGIPVGRMLAIGWGLAAAIGATAGIMVAPVLFLDPNMMGGVLLYAFAGALLGGITSPVGAVVGGLIVGVTENLVGTYLIASQLKLTVALGLDHPGAGVQAERLVRHRDRAAGVTMSKGLAAVLPQDAAAARYGGLDAGAWRWIGALALIALAAALPFAVSNYHVFELTLVMIYAIAVLGLNILTGYNGQISLGHGGFFAAGAYTAAILMHRYGVPYWATLPPAGLVCFALGVLFGLPALRFEGPYLALVTLAMAVATPQLLKYFDTWTGGQQGINLAKVQPPPGLGIDRDRWLYLVVLVVLLVAMRVAANMLNGRTGRAFVAIRDHPIAAAAMGIDVARYKTLAFGTSTSLTGIAGALSAIVIGFVAPESFSLFLSLSFLVGSAVGGIATISGAIVGGLFIEFVPNLANDISDAAPWAIYGLAMLLLMYAMPRGVVGSIGLLLQRFRVAPRRA